MAKIQKMYLKLPEGGPRPKILGLTASFENGKIDNLELKRVKLEKLLDSTLIAPEVDRKGMPQPDFKQVSYNAANVGHVWKSSIQPYMDEVVTLLQQNGVDTKWSRSTKNNSEHVLKQLGLKACLWYVRYGCVLELKAKLIQMEELKRQGKIKHVAGLSDEDSLSVKLGAIADRLEADLDAADSHAEATPKVPIANCQRDHTV